MAPARALGRLEHTYTTIGPAARAVAQRGFLRNLARGEAYQAEAPTLWDITFRTAVAQAELEDREHPGAYHRIAFPKPDGEPVRIETTRPELLPACVALVAHPDDERYQPLFGTTVRTPLFGVEVPVVAHRLAAPDKGSGIAMICTFGDLTDVTWWRELQLPTRAILGIDGRVLPDPPAGVDAAAYSRVAGKTVFSAREEIVGMLRDSGALEGEPTPITHPVKFYEKGDRPLEIVTTRQWYIRNGGRDPELRAALQQRGREIDWHPPYMRTRFDNWVEGLAGDWLISRQRFFGVPFPVWYRLDADGLPDHDSPIVADEAALPVDPASECPPGYDESQRGIAGRVHRRPRRHGHLGDVVAHAADRGRLGQRRRPVRRASSRWTCARRRTTSSAPGCSRPWCAATSSTTHCPGRTPRSPASSSTPTARRSASPRATRSCPPRSSTSTAPTPCAGVRRAPDPARTRRSTRRR